MSVEMDVKRLCRMPAYVHQRGGITKLRADLDPWLVTDIKWNPPASSTAAGYVNSTAAMGVPMQVLIASGSVNMDFAKLNEASKTAYTTVLYGTNSLYPGKFWLP